MVMGGDALSKLKENQDGEMLQAAWEQFLGLCGALSEWGWVGTLNPSITKMWHAEIVE